MQVDPVLNFGIKAAQAIDLESQNVLRFAERITELVPELDRVEHERDEAIFRLAQRKSSDVLREIEITANGIQCATNPRQSLAEQRRFLNNVAEAAEALALSPFQVSVVDFKTIYRVFHRGNHHQLMIDALWTNSPLASFASKLEIPLFNLDLSMMFEPEQREELVGLIRFQPQTDLREIKSGAYDGDSIDIVCALARIQGFRKGLLFTAILAELQKIWDDGAKSRVEEFLVEPLSQKALPLKNA